MVTAQGAGSGRFRDRAHSLTHRFSDPVPGLLVALAIAAMASGLGHVVPLVGGPVFGILLGVVVGTTVPRLRGGVFTAGIRFASRPVLQLSIVVLGSGLSLREVGRVGLSSLPVMVGTITVALGGAWVLGRLLRVGGNARTLIGVGTGICGALAIATTTAVIEASQTEVAYAVGTIFTFNVMAVLLFPPIGHLLGMSAHAFGLWSGTAINDTSSVVGAAYSFGDGAGPYAIVVKLTRTLLLIPIVVFLALRRARAGTGAVTPGGSTRSTSIPWASLIPPFLIGFVLASGLDTVGIVPPSWHPDLSLAGTFLITTALAGIGLSLRLTDLRRAGPRPLLLGAALWAAVALTSLGLQALTSGL